MATMIDSLGEI